MTFAEFMQSNFRQGNIIYIKENSLEVSVRLQLPLQSHFEATRIDIPTKNDVVNKYIEKLQLKKQNNLLK